MVRAPAPVHGKLSEITHQGQGVFRGINGPFKATRYHSLVVDRATLPGELAVTAETDDGLVMGAAHKTLPVHGVQFHPESIASENGHLILKNFLDLAAAWNASTGAGAAASVALRTVMDDFKTLIGKVATGATLTRDESAKAFDHMMSGEATPSQMGGFLMGLRLRGETVDEITGAVDHHARQDAAGRRARRTRSTWSAPAAMRPAPTISPPARPSSWRARAFRSPSTATARSRRARARPTCSARSACKIDLRPDEITRCIYEAGIGFMFAPAHHPAMKHVGPTRVELGTRTIFNLLGPLSNPAGVKRQMVGVFSRQWVEPLAQCAEESRQRARLCGARLGRARRDHHVGADRGRGAGGRQGDDVRDQAGGGRPRAREARAVARRRCRRPMRPR